MRVDIGGHAASNDETHAVSVRTPLQYVRYIRQCHGFSQRTTHTASVSISTDHHLPILFRFAFGLESSPSSRRTVAVGRGHRAPIADVDGAAAEGDVSRRMATELKARERTFVADMQRRCEVHEHRVAARAGGLVALQAPTRGPAAALPLPLA